MLSGTLIFALLQQMPSHFFLVSHAGEPVILVQIAGEVDYFLERFRLFQLQRGIQNILLPIFEAVQPAGEEFQLT